MWILLVGAGCLPPFPEPQVPATATGDTGPDVLPSGDTAGTLDDLDNDGVPSTLDCDDSDPNRFPGNDEICEDEIDQDCDEVDARCIATGVHAVQSVSDGVISGAFWVGDGGDVDDDGVDEIVVATAFPSGWAVHDHLDPFAIEQASIPAILIWAASGRDVDGAGYDDILIAASTAGASQVELRFGPFGTPGSTVRQWTDTQFGGSLGYDVAVVPDTDGDDHPDLWIGLFNPTYNEPAQAILLTSGHEGPAVGLDITDDQTFWARIGFKGGSIGGSVAGADLDGDGLGELILGTAGDRFGPKLADPMQLFVYPGGSTGVQSGIPDYQDLLTILHGGTDPDSVYDPTGGFLSGTATPAAPATGDVDGDGCDDLFSGFVYEAGRRGGALLMLGCQDFDPRMSPETADAVILGPGVDTAFGISATVSPAMLGTRGGVAIGAPLADGLNGRSYVFDGADLQGTIDLDVSPTAPLMELTSGRGRELGWNTGSPGDLDGDGYGDLIVGEPGFDTVNLLYPILGGALP